MFLLPLPHFLWAEEGEVPVHCLPSRSSSPSHTDLTRGREQLAKQRVPEVECPAASSQLPLLFSSGLYTSQCGCLLHLDAGGGGGGITWQRSGEGSELTMKLSRPVRMVATDQAGFQVSG